MLIFTDTPPPPKCMVCTLVKMLTFLNGPLHSVVNCNYLKKNR